MLHTVDNTEFSRGMDLFKEIDDLSDLFLLEKNTKLGCPEEGYEDLQNKYSSLHENYAKEIENSKKVEKCLIKCLKFYSKLSKKYEVQQQIIRDLEESIKEKVNNLEEAQKNEEKMKGVIQVYRTERTVYAGQTSMQLRKEKELLLDICCKLISESVKSHNTSTLSNLLLRKFRKDLTEEKIILLKSKSVKPKDEVANPDEIGNALKPEPGALKDEFKSEDKYSSDVSKGEMKGSEEDVTTNLPNLGQCEVTTEEISCLEHDNSQEGSDKLPSVETEQDPSLPSLEELPLSLEPICTNNEEEHGSDVACANILRECDVLQECSSPAGRQKSDVRDTGTENMESQYSEKLEEPTFKKNPRNDFDVRKQNDRQEHPSQPAERSTSIFDICDECPNSGDSRAGSGTQEIEAEETEFFSEVSFVREHKSEEISLVNNTNRLNLDVRDSGGDDDSICAYESEVLRIFKEMCSVRLLSPIRETNSSSADIEACRVVPSENKNSVGGKTGLGLKRNADVVREMQNCRRIKKFKSEEETPTNCLLDSIMSAMSIQNEEFKWKKFASKEPGESGEISEGSSCEVARTPVKVSPRRTRKLNGNSEEKSAVVRHASGRSRDSQQTMERLVAEEIKNFVSASISCKEDADRNVKHCISVLMGKPEDMIAKCIVTTVLENIDEDVEIFERPAPPLTKTQHRLVVLLSVFRSLDWNSEKICTKILSIISEKLFPDNFFWPDDSVEAATRFYAALCRARNEPKTLWKFCLGAMTDMRQRCPLIVFTALKTWPDVLHDASTLKNNTLALTVVNIFLHMPRTEGLRNTNQKRKLTALKHLLLNFYQFKMDDTIEGYAKKVVEGIRKEEAGSEKSILLLSRCRDQKWTLKNVVPELKSTLVAWSEGTVADSVASTILSVIKQICPIFTQGNNATVKELALCLSEILTSGKKSHDSEVNLAEVLLMLKQYPEARKAICEWIPKTDIGDSLRNEIINASAENVLRELKLNRKKETRNHPIKKKQWKKPRGKKLKGKKRKKNEQKSKA